MVGMTHKTFLITLTLSGVMVLFNFVGSDILSYKRLGRTILTLKLASV